MAPDEHGSREFDVPDVEPDLVDPGSKTQPAEGGRDEVADLPGADGPDRREPSRDEPSSDGD